MEQTTPLMIVSQREVSRETLENIFVTALEGGSNFWYLINSKTIKKVRDAVPISVDQCISTAIFKAIMDFGVEVEVHDIENTDEILGVISYKTINKRLQLLADSAYSWALINEIDENGDAESSDIVFQYLVMEDVVFA